jgi:MFS family permease
MATFAFPTGAFRLIPRSVWILGFVSLLMDVSSEAIHAVLPVYLVTVLGTSTLTVGFIEGIAEATAAITKVFSGALSDWLGNRKGLATLGYGLAALTKPVFALAGSVGWLVAARFVDRVGKGIRGAPRDALVADLAPPELRGASFGLRQALDTVGAFVGPLLAILVMMVTADNFIAVFWVAVVPAFLSFALITFFVKEPSHPRETRARGIPLGRTALARLGAVYWWIAAIGAVFTLARFSEAFLVLKAQASGLPLAWVPLVMVLMNVIYALAAYPAGALSDRIDRIGMLIAGIAVLIGADLVLAFSVDVAGVAVGVALWGLHLGLTQGLLAALIADAAPGDLRGTAFGVFNLLSGAALLAASVVAGALWSSTGPGATFIAGAVLAVAALLGLLAIRGRLRPGKPVAPRSDQAPHQP